MKMQRTFAVGLLAGLLAAVPAFGQGEDAAQLAKIPPNVRAGAQTEFMTKKLSLTPQERTQVEAINLKYANQMQPVLEGSGGPLQRMREAKRIDEAKDAELKGVLTPQQFQGYVAAKEELRKKMMEKAAGGSAPTAP